MCICGKDSCNGLCEMGLGKKLYDFYTNWYQSGLYRDVEIGNTELERPGSTKYLVVKGHTFYPKKEGIYNQTGRILTYREKLNGVRIESIFKIGAPIISKSLNAYASLKLKDASEIDKARKFYVDLLNYKKVLIPIDLDASVDVMIHRVEREKQIDYLAKGEIKYIKWCLDENGRIQCTVAVKPEKDKVAKEKNITGYGTEIVDRSASAVIPDKGHLVIQMSKFGYIKPIIIKGNMQCVGIDGTSIYLGTTPDNLREIGHWEGNNIVSMELGNIRETEIISVIRKYKSYIAVTRKKIAPYFIGEPNIVDINKIR